MISMNFLHSPMLQRRISQCIVLASLMLLSLHCSSRAQELQGKVVAVKDGDTIELLVEGRAMRIRFNGVDTPEKGQPYGDDARRFTSDLCFGEVVTARMFEKDRYDRMICDIILPDGRVLNRELVAAGYAWWYRAYSKDRDLERLESIARQKRLGLWADPNPVAPWEWRRKQREGDAAAAPGNTSAGAASTRPAGHVVDKSHADSDTVYITKSGKAYHLPGCEGLKYTSIPMTLKEARVIRRPCPNCGAPK